ncbi:MAG: SpoIIE family protein phosphatase [Clostridia bacterium]|nr:SpoIIE family protein phosphatase [Clostridia bacterium]
MLQPDFSRPASGSLRPVFIHAIRFTGAALVIALLSGAQLAGELSPFAPAAAAAGLRWGVHPLAILTGCALSGLLSGPGLTGWLPLVSCALLCALHLSLKPLRRFLPDPPGMDDFLSGALAGLSLLAPGLIFSGGLMYNLLAAVLSAAVASLLAPALYSAMGVRLFRKRLMPEEQLSLSLFLAVLLIGIHHVPMAGRFLSLSCALVLTLVCSGAGAGMGALAGIAAGSALSMAGSHPFMGSTLCLCGLLAGCLSRGPRIAACGAVFFANTLTVTWGLGFTVGAMELPPVFAGCLVYCLLPKRLLHHFHGWMRPALPHTDPEALSVRLRKKAGRRLMQISEIFGELADGYSEKSPLPTEQEIISEGRKALCSGCEGYAACWSGNSPPAARLLCRMAAEALAGKEITPARDLPPDLLRHCRRSGKIDQTLLPALSRLAQTRRDVLRRGDSKALLSGQFREAQRLLDSLSTQMTGEICLSREYAGLARAALDRAGIRVKEVTAVLDDKLEIICLLKDGIWNPSSAQHVAYLLTEELGVPFSPVLSRGRVPGECELRLLQAPALTASFASASAPADESAPSGDGSIACILPDGRVIAALSDGMGSGEEAAVQSARCLSLLRKFVSAGVDRDAALSAVNRLLLLKNTSDLFATADLCVIDLYSGVASFSKLGACRSFILGDKGLREIPGGRLPLGILDRIEPATFRAEVHPGDLLIMFTDGVADELKEGQAEALRAYLPSVRHMKPQDAADAVLRWADERSSSSPKDDRSVLAVRILARKLKRR